MSTPPLRSCIEPLEARIAPATFIVTTVADTGPGSLRQAILDANAAIGADTITFSISGTSIIKPLTHLPAIVGKTSIAGMVNGTRISIDGSGAVGASDSNNASGLMIFGSVSNGSSISGLAIYGFDRAGIEIVGSSNNSITNSYLGVNASGDTVKTRMVEGVLIRGGIGNVIGAPVGGNVIGGNDIGIRVNGDAIGTSIDGNRIGNIQIRTDHLEPRSNDIGILVDKAAGTKIGVSNRNTISFNTTFGIELTASANDTRIIGNTVGSRFEHGYTDRNDFQNWGIHLDRAIGTIIENNDISQHSAGGIWVDLRSVAIATTIANNWIRTNQGPGVFVSCTDSTSFNAPSPSLAIHSNVISENWEAGIQFLGAYSISATIKGNKVGSNYGSGITIENSSGITIGGERSDANEIHRSAGNGIEIIRSSKIQVRENHIGYTNQHPAYAYGGNKGHGIYLFNSSDISISKAQIMYNRGDGIFIGSSPLQDVGHRISIIGNTIGTIDGGGNWGVGIRVAGFVPATIMDIGGSQPGEGNLIAGNKLEGIVVEQSAWVNINGNFVVSDHAALRLSLAQGTWILGNQLISTGATAVVFENGTSDTHFGTESEGNVVRGERVGVSIDADNSWVVGNTISAVSMGVEVLGGQNHLISHNQFTVQEGLFIDLNGDGLTPNDPLDSDSGPNTLLNSPLLVSAVVRGGQTLLRGEYRGLANVDVRVEWYVEGEFFAEMNAHTDESGFTKLMLDLDQEIVPGSRLSASAIVASNTSEFALSVIATTPPEVIAKGAVPGHKPRVQLRDALTGELVMEQLAFGKAFRGGVSVATADVDGDGFTDLIATTHTGNPLVKVFSGLDGHKISQFNAGPAGAAIRSIAAGDLDGDGSIEVIIGRARTVGGIVSVHDAFTGASEARLTPFGFNTPDRLKVSLSDVDGDELPEIIVRGEVFGGVKEVTIDPIARADASQS